MNKQRSSDVEKILLENYDSYYRLAFSYVKQEQDALDIVQESAYKAVRDCHKVSNPAYLKTWIYRIVVNTALDFLRKQKWEEPADTQPELSTEDTYQEWDLKDVLNKLAKQDRVIIILRYFEDLKLEEISEITGENLNTVKARLYRSLKKMRLALEA